MAIRFSNTKPEKGLTYILPKKSGRDNTGSISVRHQGGRHKRFYRMIDFKRDKFGIEGTIISVEYDPNRTANIALVEYKDGERRYVLHAVGMEAGNKVVSGVYDNMQVGSAMPLSAIPLGVEIHNIELYPGKGGKIVKSAGSTATIIAKDDKYADVKLPSKEVRKILLNCMATLGRISNIEHKLENLGKAGRSRHMGIRPTVRGVAQNPRSHPHGGGEGKSGQGMHPKTPWGKSARGTRTRKPKYSDALIVKRRSK
ncbi:50S ribosomal protein L2 [Candidatus Woesebacteria bacterium]|nr:50S ribosomal protein L2 [Candidatus Woesebacteria bacterium]